MSQLRQPFDVGLLTPPARIRALEMSPALDQLSVKFAAWSRSCRFDVLDMGCGDGIATLAALARGAHVMAVDPDENAIRQLVARMPSQQFRRLKLRTARMPELDFSLAHFSAVHAARVLHVLDGEALQKSLRTFFRWLYPEGKLFISTLAPSGLFWKGFQSEYLRRVMKQEPWPGYIGRPSWHFREWGAGSGLVHLLDEQVLRRELEAAGFLIEEISCYTLPWDTDQVCCGVVARCGS